jgi:tRNA threonylcarbamoyladenosine biosynthesis protein TsaB
MNTLYIDTTKEISIVKLFVGSVLKSEASWIAGRNLGSELLPKIDELLNKEKIKLTELNIILVNPGPGSFTGCRIGVVTANTLAWSLDIPVITSVNPQEDILRLKLGLKYSQPVAVIYDRPASVTVRTD